MARRFRSRLADGKCVRHDTGLRVSRRRLAFEPLEERRLLAIVTVTTLSDTVDLNDGVTSLREAVVAANATPVADTIDFSSTLTANGPATILLTQGELAITRSLTIQGPGANLLTIDASGNDPTPTQDNGDGSRVFNIDDGNSAALSDVVISGATLTNGDASGSGGAIANHENLTIGDCIITRNAAVAPSASGGGIAHYSGVLSIERTTIGKNFATDFGGGVFSDHGSFHLANSTVWSNKSLAGGAVYGNFSTSMEIVGSTIGQNKATGNAGGIGLSDSNLSVSFSTIAYNVSDSDSAGGENGGGLFVSDSSTVTLDHTILSNNSRAIRRADDLDGQVAAYYSLIGNSTGGTVINVGDTSLIGTGTSYISARLGPLAYNGGPTETYSLTAASPAIDRGQPDIIAPPATDQRGAPFVRIYDGDGADGPRIDIGAYERQSVPSMSLVVDTLIDESDMDYSQGDLSLREALGFANGNIGSEIITFAPSLTNAGPATILLRYDQLDIVDPVTIIGPGASLLTLDASASDPTPDIDNGDGSYVLSIDDSTYSISSAIDVEVSGLTLTGSDFVEGIRNYENLTLRECNITGNHSTFGGGGIYHLFGSMTIQDCTISGNTTDGDGGGIHCRGDLSISNSTISGNTAKKSGGGIYVTDGGADVTVTNSTISGNASMTSGGGIQINAAHIVRVAHSTITANRVESDFDDGGARGAGVSRRIFAKFFYLDHTIVAGNYWSSHGDDIAGYVAAENSLIGDNRSGNFISDQDGNIVGTDASPVDPMLGPLAYNGGTTKTHALLPGSPAIDAGDPAAEVGVGGVPEFDQRGTPWSRVVGGRIDIGAVESQPNPLPGDYNFNGIVDAADYTVWRDTFGATTDLRADGSGATAGVPDGVVDSLDYNFWKSQFGNELASGAGADAIAPLAGELRLAGTGASSATEVSGEHSSPAIEWAVWAPVTGAASAGRRLAVAVQPVLSDSVQANSLLDWLTSRVDHRSADDQNSDLSVLHEECAEAGRARATIDCAFELLGQN